MGRSCDLFNGHLQISSLVAIVLVAADTTTCKVDQLTRPAKAGAGGHDVYVEILHTVKVTLPVVGSNARDCRAVG